MQSSGATWLALHSWTAPPVYDRGRIFWNSGRGNVLALREQDGAILWSRDLQPRGPAGLRDHLEFVDLNRPALQVREDRVFLQVPGTSRIQQLSATTGQVHSGLPVAEGTLWEVSRSGDQCVMITTDGKVKSWRLPVEKNPSASLEWQTVWPNPSPGKPLSVDFREDGQIKGDNCLGQTWYLAFDMQWFLVSPLVVYPLWLAKYGKPQTVAAVSYWIVLFLAFLAPMIAFYDDPITWIKYHIEHLLPFFPGFAPWGQRSHCYLLGLMMGFILHSTKSKNIKIHLCGCWPSCWPVPLPMELTTLQIILLWR